MTELEKALEGIKAQVSGIIKYKNCTKNLLFNLQIQQDRKQTYI